MRELIGSRSTSLSVASGPSEDGDAGNVSEAYERALAEAKAHMIDLEELDPALQSLLSCVTVRVLDKCRR